MSRKSVLSSNRPKLKLSEIQAKQKLRMGIHDTVILNTAKETYLTTPAGFMKAFHLGHMNGDKAKYTPLARAAELVPLEMRC